MHSQITDLTQRYKEGYFC